GTRATMEEPFLRERLERGFGIEVLVPAASDREALENIIFEEMARGRFLPEAKRYAARLVAELAARGAQAVVLGCTELPILLRDAALACPTLDPARLHALAAADFSLQCAV